MRAALLLSSLLIVPGVLAQAPIESIQINQAIGVQKNGALKFVAGKDTVVRALLAAPVTVDPNQTNATIVRDGQTVATLAPQSTEGPASVVDFPCPSRDACGSWAAGSYTFEVRVNGATRSTAGTDYRFVERVAIRILAVPVTANYGGKVVPVTDDRWRTLGDYVRATYPVAADKLIWQTREDFDASDSSFDLETDDGRRNLWEALARLIPASCAGTPEADGCFNQVFGFIMSRPNGYPNGNLQGYTYGKPANIGVITDEDAAATVAHEIGHTYGLGDTYDGGSFACNVNPAPDEFKGKDFDDASKEAVCMRGRVALEGVSGTKIPAEHHPYEVGGRGALGAAAEYMGSGGKQSQFWTTQDAYDHLFDALAPQQTAAAKAAAPQRFIQCFGAIRDNATTPADVQMDACWTFMDEDLLPNTTGKYMLAAVNAAGTRLATRAFDPEFDPVAPKGLAPQRIALAQFIGEMSFPESTARLQVLRDNAVVTEIAVSPNSPVVTNVAPELRGNVSGKVTFTWDASDADGNTLVYEILYNPDAANDESEWWVLGDVKVRRFTLDLDDLPGGPDARVAVIASDGINSGEGISGAFVVPPKAPLVFIEEVPNTVLAGRELVLDGDAFDFQDDDIFESQLRWSSNLSGTLGTGTPLRVANLPVGSHTITLSVTNSLGLTGTDSIRVTVLRAVGRHRAAR